MKINNKKVIISTLALAMGAALAGSISGSVAWYQYSTRATASLSGVAAGTSRNLQISATVANDSWGWDLQNSDLVLGDATQTGDLQPVGGVIGAHNVPDTTKFTGFGVRQYALPDAEAKDYLNFDIYLRSVKEDNSLEAVDIYLETFNVTFAAGANAKLDSALRIAIIKDEQADGNLVLSKTAHETVTAGKLDLNNDDLADRDIFEADDHRGLVNDNGTWKLVESKDAVETATGAEDELVAGASASGWYTDPDCAAAHEATAIEANKTYYKIGAEPEMIDFDDVDDDNPSGKYLNYVTAGNTDDKYASTAWSGVKATFSDAYTLDDTNGAPTPIASTTAGNHVKLSFVIWLEGWEKINDNAVWANPLAKEDFSIQMRFQTLAVK